MNKDEKYVDVGWIEMVLFKAHIKVRMKVFFVSS